MAGFKGRDDELVTYKNSEIKSKTDKGVFVIIDKEFTKTKQPEEVFIPQSQIHDNSEIWKPGEKGKLVIPLWLAENRGLKT